jgi:hypothetical protein
MFSVDRISRFLNIICGIIYPLVARETICGAGEPDRQAETINIQDCRVVIEDAYGY